MSAAVGWSAEMADQVRAQLAVLDLQAAGVTRCPVNVEVVRAQLPGLIVAWWRLLQTHHPADGESRCSRCRSWWGRGAALAVWRTAHTSLVVCQVPSVAPDAVAAAVAWVREASSARPLGARMFPVPRPSSSQLPRQSPTGRSVVRFSAAGGTSGAAACGPSLLAGGGGTGHFAGAACTCIPPGWASKGETLS